MARPASRKASASPRRKSMMKRSGPKKVASKKVAPKKASAGARTKHQVCVSRKAKVMHKKARTARAHQLALSRANKACA